MTSWTKRHAAALSRDLDDGEHILAAHRVEVRGAVPDAVDGERVSTRGSSRRRFMKANELGWQLPGPIFVLGISERRVLFYRASPMVGAPLELEHWIPLTDIANVVHVRRLGRGHLAILRADGPLLVVRSLWGRGLHELEQAFVRS